MSRRCCDGACHQGRTCPVRTVCIPTRRGLLSRIVDAIVAVCDACPWVPPAIAIAILFIVNS
jgi:hypothetical protein